MNSGSESPAGVGRTPALAPGDVFARDVRLPGRARQSNRRCEGEAWGPHNSTKPELEAHSSIGAQVSRGSVCGIGFGKKLD